MCFFVERYDVAIELYCTEITLLYTPSECSEWGYTVMLDSVCAQSINRLRRHHCMRHR